MLILGGFLWANLWFLASVIRKRNDIADVAWGLGILSLGWGALILSANGGIKPILVVLIVTIWGLRLAVHISARARGKSEDPRYAKWRQTWGKWFWIRSYFQVYILQGVLMFLVALPVIWVAANGGNSLQILDFLGLGIWGMGFLFEWIGDQQLKNFLKDPKNKGKIMTTGLWSRTRHPNYFGEVTLWWGIWIMAMSDFGAFWTILGPITITILILKVSGISMLEKKYEGRADFEKYKQETPAFFPKFF